MVFQRTNRTGLDYDLCRYGTSKLGFRGPLVDTDTPYVACLGGSSTYGRFVAAPYPNLLARQLDLPVMNLGVVNAGVDVFLHDPSVVGLCRGARVTLVQVTGAHNLSNRLYSVHPRRNDRFTKASTLLQTIYSDVDFTDFHYTRHMLGTLNAVSPDRFRIVRDELKTAWLARMKLLLKRIGGRIVLLWVQRPRTKAAQGEEGPLAQSPMLIDGDMIGKLAAFVGDTVVHRLDANDDTNGMVFEPIDAGAAREFPGPGAHQQVCDAVEPRLRAALN